MTNGNRVKFSYTPYGRRLADLLTEEYIFSQRLTIEGPSRLNLESAGKMKQKLRTPSLLSIQDSSGEALQLPPNNFAIFRKLMMGRVFLYSPNVVGGGCWGWLAMVGGGRTWTRRRTN
ncbi:uncharacterized protein LOC124294928 [Neodiprion lecontei]|uniref:Uncharacterized protein LOC124294928 n=1 Tax=Neodiprion lecontei TaxID=441921 RepID=A0ABM3GDV9_NEOLC|nr:uncharacterized protein LOC124294928 [Neodiprion lecontei]